jgi:hypothetical protein
MNFRMRSVLRLSVAVCALLLVAGGRASEASAPAQPKLSGTYAVQIHEFCQPNLLAQVLELGSEPPPLAFSSFSSVGLIKDQIGVLTFNAKQLTISGSMIKVTGAVVSQDLTAVGGPVDVTPFTETTNTTSGTFSTTDTTFTIDKGSGPTTYNAVYGAFSGSTAAAVFFVAISTDSQGDSCAESGELQLK